MREVKLPSGAVLKVNLAPFPESKALYKAVIAEVKGIQLLSSAEMANVYKDLFCAGMSSDKIEACLMKCLLRCTYNDHQIKDLDLLFEPLQAREDYLHVCLEVAIENLLPFGKDLYALFERAILAFDKRLA